MYESFAFPYQELTANLYILLVTTWEPYKEPVQTLSSFQERRATTCLTFCGLEVCRASHSLRYHLLPTAELTPVEQG